jgi:hypothetical protein
MGLEIVLTIAGVVILVLIALQISEFYRGRSIISARQLGMRVVSGVLLVVMLGLIYYGVHHTWDRPIIELIFWLIVALFLPVMVIIVAVMDLRETTGRAQYRQALLLSDALKAGREAAQHAEDEGGGEQ